MKPIYTCLGAALLFLSSCSTTESNLLDITNIQHATVNQSISVDNDDSKNKLKVDIDGDHVEDLLITAYNSQQSPGCGNYKIQLSGLSATISFSFTEAIVHENTGITNRFISNIDPGITIGSALEWITSEDSDGLIFNDTHGVCIRPEVPSLFFSSPTARETLMIRYMPFSMHNNVTGNTHYGWIQVKGEYLGDNSNTVKLTIMDLAFNAHPGEPIIAGEVQ